MPKSLIPDIVDPNHTYVFKTSDYGIKDYWYRDMHGNYWRYTNAPEDHKDFDPYAGIPLLARDQPMPSTAPAFFTLEGRKRHIAVPAGIIADRNPNYNPLDSKNIWYEVFVSGNHKRYIYLDADIRENTDLFVQYQLRVTDSRIPALRKFAYNLFQNEHPKDKIVGAILILMDQGLYELEELLNAIVDDIEFIDETVKLLGRKFRCDSILLDFLTSLVGPRDKSAPLFQLNTVHGKSAVGLNYMYSILHHLKVSPSYLLYWHASSSFSRIVNRLSYEELPVKEVEAKALSELQRVFTTTENIQFLVDHKVRSILLDNYSSSMGKSLTLERNTTDEYATLLVFSDLTGLDDGEAEFSKWLHSEPMHDITPAEEAAVDEMVLDEEASDGSDGSQDLVDAAGAEVGTTDTAPGKEVGVT